MCCFYFLSLFFLYVCPIIVMANTWPSDVLPTRILSCAEFIIPHSISRAYFACHRVSSACLRFLHKTIGTVLTNTLACTWYAWSIRTSTTCLYICQQHHNQTIRSVWFTANCVCPSSTNPAKQRKKITTTNLPNDRPHALCTTNPSKHPARTSPSTPSDARAFPKMTQCGHPSGIPQKFHCRNRPAERVYSRQVIVQRAHILRVANTKQNLCVLPDEQRACARTITCIACRHANVR